MIARASWPSARLVAGLAVLGLAHAAESQQLDRSKRPVAPPPPAFVFPEVHSQSLANGLVVRVVENHALPLVAVRVFVEGGALLDPAGKEGLFTLDTLILRDGTTTMNAEQLGDAIDVVGAPVTPTRFTVVTGEFERALGLIGDMLMHPSFPAEAVDRRKAAATNTIQRQEAVVSATALRVFGTMIWGASHPFARAATPASLASITRDDVVRFHDTYVRPQNVTVTIVGDISTAAAVSAVTKVFGDWQRTGARVTIDAPAPPPAKPTTIYLVDRPNAPQATVVVGQTVLSRSNPDFFALDAMGAMLGGPTGSRLTMSLRERRPLSYSVSHIPVWRRVSDPSAIYGSGNVDPAKVDSALAVWLDELKGIAGARPPMPAELTFARAVLVDGLLTRIETIDEVANRLNLIARDGLPTTYYNDYVRGMSRVTVADVAAAAAKTIDPAHTTIVIAGDRKRIEPALRAANLAPVVIVDVSGNPVP